MLYWRRPLISIISLIGWLLFVNFFQIWMVPFGLAIGILAGKFAPPENVENSADKKEKKDKEKKSSAVKDFKILADSKEALRNFQE